MNRRPLRLSLTLLAAASMLATFGPVGAVTASAASPGVSISHLAYLGSTSLRATGSGSTGTGNTATEFSPAGQSVDESIPNSGLSAARVPANGVPKVADNGLAAPGNEMVGTFSGLNHHDQRLAGTGDYAGTQFSLEPPDQALCVGGGYIVESVNTAIAVYDKSGNQLAGPEALNQLFGLAPEIDRTTLTYGDFTSDPKCLYDSGHFILSLLQADVVSTTGAFSGGTSVLLAVSATGDPTGAWNVYKLGTTNDGAGCPCLPDQPLIGADANGFYVTTNSFQLFGPGFNGAQVYAMSKSQLESGAESVDVVNVPVSAPAGFDGIPYSLQPAKTVPGTTDVADTEYFLSALDFNATLDNRIALWTLTGTNTLGTAAPSLALTGKVIGSEVYGQPPAAQQSNTGPFPLRDYLSINPQLALYGALFDRAAYRTELLNSNDDRMNEVVYAGGKLYGALNSVVKPAQGTVQTGIAWFVVNPTDGSMANQGYLAVSGESLLFPAFGVNSDGKGAIGVTITGLDMHPSTAYAMFDGAGFGPLHISQAGPVADDGFTGYLGVSKNGRPNGHTGVARWGDYGAAVVDTDGSIWLANETTSATRTLFANWATQITHVNP